MCPDVYIFSGHLHLSLMTKFTAFFVKSTSKVKNIFQYFLKKNMNNYNSHPKQEKEVKLSSLFLYDGYSFFQFLF